MTTITEFYTKYDKFNKRKAYFKRLVKGKR